MKHKEYLKTVYKVPEKLDVFSAIKNTPEEDLKWVKANFPTLLEKLKDL